VTVAVTGVGAVSAWGWGAEALWSGLAAGDTAVRPFHRFDAARYATHLAAEVPPPPRRIRALQSWNAADAGSDKPRTASSHGTNWPVP